MSEGIRCMWMRGGSSKGAYFLESDLPSDSLERDKLLLQVMGSPDIRQIDGIGGADPLTSKVAVVSKSSRDDADVEYLFLQVFVDKPIVSDAQGCGNLLAGVGPFALERQMIKPTDGETQVRIYTRNTGEITTAKVCTPDCRVSYSGEAMIAGVPGAHAPVPLLFHGSAGAMCGALLPTGNARDTVDGIDVTLVDNGMPCVILKASDMQISGNESREDLESNAELKQRLEHLRLASGKLMNLGNVKDKSVPKMTMVSPPLNGGVINTRSLIPHRVHASIGVMAAVTVATACRLQGSVAAQCAVLPAGLEFDVEHPSGVLQVLLQIDAVGQVVAAGTQRTARKLFDGRVFP
ncbi:MAG: 4-oxalomesaconate tautomerase [Granulosicoccus sp.]